MKTLITATKAAKAFIDARPAFNWDDMCVAADTLVVPAPKAAPLPVFIDYDTAGVPEEEHHGQVEWSVLLDEAEDIYMGRKPAPEEFQHLMALDYEDFCEAYLNAA